jgi:hypothetical protein
MFTYIQNYQNYHNADKLNVYLYLELPEYLPALGDPASVQHTRLSGGERPQAGLPEHQHHHPGR